MTGPTARRWAAALAALTVATLLLALNDAAHPRVVRDIDCRPVADLVVCVTDYANGDRELTHGPEEDSQGDPIAL